MRRANRRRTPTAFQRASLQWSGPRFHRVSLPQHRNRRQIQTLPHSSVYPDEWTSVEQVHRRNSSTAAKGKTQITWIIISDLASFITTHYTYCVFHVYIKQILYWFIHTVWCMSYLGSCNQLPHRIFNQNSISRNASHWRGIRADIEWEYWIHTDIIVFWEFWNWWTVSRSATSLLKLRA